MLVYPTNQLAFASEEARQAHERRYKNFQSAQNVWRQLSVEDRVYVLQKAGYDDLNAAHADTLASIRATGARRDRIISAIRFAQRGDPRFRERYKAAHATRPRDVRVRAHEKELRAKGLRRPRGG